MSTPPAARPRRWTVPVTLLLVSAAVLALPGLWWWADLNPTPQSGLILVARVVAPLCWLLVVVWFFAFSGLAGRIKLTGAVVLLTLLGTAVAAVRSVDIDGTLRPLPHFRWEPSPEDALDRHREGERDSDSPALPAIDLKVDPLIHFPCYRGVQGDGVVYPLEPLAADWSKTAPEVLWRQPCGGGFAGFAVAGNVAITIEQRREDEAIVCYDRGSGRERWVYSYPARFRDVTGDGPRATPTIYKGRVYSFGATGELVCLDGATGKKVWQRNAVEDSQARVVTWGMSSSPLVVEELGLVIVNPGIDPNNNAGKALAAYRLKDGEVVWAKGDQAAAYSSAMLVTQLAGRRQVLLLDRGGLAGFDPTTGNELWRHPWQTSLGMNIVQPVVFDGDKVFISSEASNGGALLRVSRKGDEFAVAVLWANKSLASKFSNPVALGEGIYGLSLGTMVCLDKRTGKRAWRGRYYGHGQILAIGGKLLVMSERGYIALVAADMKQFRELARMDVFADRTWNTPALAGRQLFIRNDREMACLELPLKD
jgi:outer membrane protein assembly factor BamB